MSSWTKALRHRANSLWEPPPSNSWKWNVDRYARGKPGPAGIGGVLCDDKGRILAKFAAFVGVRDSNISGIDCDSQRT